MLYLPAWRVAPYTPRTGMEEGTVCQAAGGRDDMPDLGTQTASQGLLAGTSHQTASTSLGGRQSLQAGGSQPPP